MHKVPLINTVPASARCFILPSVAKMIIFMPVPSLQSGITCHLLSGPIHLQNTPQLVSVAQREAVYTFLNKEVLSSI